MIASGHTAVGAIVGLSSYQLLANTPLVAGLTIAAAAGIVAHYIADTIPHGHLFKFKDYNKKIFQVIILDLCLGIFIFETLGLLKFGLTPPFFYLSFAILGSQLPDCLDGLIYTKKIPNKGLLRLENSFHQLTHWHGTLEKALLFGKTDFWQIAVILIALFLVYIS